MFCEYCKTEFKTISALNNHKLKAKYCLIIQGNILKYTNKNVKVGKKKIYLIANFVIKFYPQNKI